MAKASGAGFKKILLEKGELIALVGCGAGAFLFLVWGVLAFASAGAPVSPAEIDTKTKGIEQGLKAPGQGAPPQPEWVEKAAGYPPVTSNQFALAGMPFAPIHQPDMLRENPKVVGIDDYQINLVRAPMPALDMYQTGEGKTMIGVLVAKPKGDTNVQNLAKQTKEALSNFQGRPPQAPRRPAGQQPPPGTQPPGGTGTPQPPSGPGPGAGGPGGRSGSGDGGDSGGLTNPYGGGPGDGTAAGVRDDRTVLYVSPEEVERKGLPLAKTVYPLRMLVVHGAIPLNAQRDEIRRALRIPDVKYPNSTVSVPNPEVEPFFDGIEVDRRLALPGGTIDDNAPWSEFNHYDEYFTKIRARKIEDQPDNGGDGYLSLFMRYDQKLSAPLPLLADQLGAYAPIQMESIKANIAKLKQANKPPPTVSEWQNRFRDGAGSSNPYAPYNSNTYGGAGQPGSGSGDGGRPGGPGGPGAAPSPGGFPPPSGPGGPGTTPQPGGPGAQVQQTLPEIDHLLLRFLDPDVKPGFTYQYRVRLRMKNPNFGLKGRVGRDDDAKQEILYGRWVIIPQKETIPYESFLYAYDANKYLDQSKAISDAAGKDPKIAQLMEDREIREGKRAVVQVQTWMPQLRLDGAGAKTEPIGTWIVSAMPVAPGEYIGRRQLVELPLWSAGIVNYVLRELSGGVKVANLKDPKNQPKGWPVNFRTLSVLVDFEGGKSKTRVNDKDVFDDAASELLIIRPDGKMIVRSSADDMLEANRAKRNKDWDEWLIRVKARKDIADPNAPPPGTPGGFVRPGGGS